MASPSNSGHAEWPSNSLDAAREAFAWLTAGDHPVALDGRLFDHLPNREIPVDELRDLLLRRSCPRRVWDQVWRHVITRSRAEGGTWTIVAVGLALPMLTPMAARLTDRYAGDPADIHAEIVSGFLDALQTVDLTRGRITIRLRWAAYRAGHRALLAALDGPTPKAPGFFSAEPKPPSGHPDLVLARAVEVGVLARTEAEVIAETRLDETPLNEWAAEAEIEFWAAYKMRKRAEHRLAAWLSESADGSHDSDPPSQAVTSQTVPRTASNTAGRSQNVTKKGGGGLSNEPPNSGLQGRG
ncbi:hypothetical protein GCM10012275_59570 [Longimycelium tulufanense]|uniref:Uncharacterized protein n=1 Tax=Longimycelium tulufanense TaxID=907463 RepID=A0A8J3CEB0_9PSEU|nr:hypothetical protein [Longimycelium tulufanense]GGM81006.1 hypothetical protein GCM10012275_59570 [Longimycelium tulufanense]